MAQPKSLWTPDMYQRLKRSMSFVVTGFSILFFLVFLLMLNEEPGMSIFVAIAGVISLIGLLSMRSVFRDLVSQSGPVAKTAPVAASQPLGRPEEAGLSQTPEDQWLKIQPSKAGTSKPQAAIRSTKTAASTPMWTQQIDWEEWVGKKLLQKAGILIVLVGMLVFLKYSFDNKWIDELGRIAMSVIGAGALLIAGEWFHRKYALWSQAFTGGGLVLLYFTVWVAHVMYAAELASKYGLVVPSSLAFVLYSLITLVGAIAAVRYKAQTVAWFTVLGGYATPMLVDSPGGGEMTLAVYLGILTAGLLLLAWHQKWRFLNIAAFGLTELYLFGVIYQAPEHIISNAAQIVIAVVFLVLFSALPVLYQFRLRLKAQADDILIVILNGLATFLATIDALGGYESGYIGFVCLAFALLYLVFAASALQSRAEDAPLVNTYLVGAVIFVAGALFAELEREWVAAGWAPLSLLLVFISARLQRRGPWVCAILLLIGSLAFLASNLPMLEATSETIWRPFTSNWSIQSYIVFAVIAGWVKLAPKLPQVLMPAAEHQRVLNVFHAVLAVILFLFITFEVTRLNWEITLPLMYAYVFFAVLSLGAFLWTRSLSWFVAAILTHVFVWVAIYVLGEGSTMIIPLIDSKDVMPIVHPWALVSVVSLLLTVAMVYAVQMQKDLRADIVGMRPLLIGAALMQIWVHGSVEITHLAMAYEWTTLFAARAMSAWWIGLAVAVSIAGVLLNNRRLRLGGLALFLPPLFKDNLLVLDGTGDFTETVVWTVIALVLLGLGAKKGWRETLLAGAIFLGLTMAVDMMTHLGDGEAGLVRSVWWAVVALTAMTGGFVLREKSLRQIAIGIFGVTAAKLLLIDFSGLEVPVRIGASIGTGLLMIGASYLYQRFDTMLPRKKS